LPELARKITDDLKTHYKVIYDQQGSIGKRYYRQDEAGTPFGITIDHQTLEDNTVTIRHRDTQKQDRINVDSLIEKLDDEIKNWS
jgi:glycyl-tRNA synthetase